MTVRKIIFIVALFFCAFLSYSYSLALTNSESLIPALPTVADTITSTTKDNSQNLGGSVQSTIFSPAFTTTPFVRPTDGLEWYETQVVSHVSENPLSITLEWPAESSTTNFVIYRKARTDTSWGSSIATVSGNLTSYIDTSIATGTGYEYRVSKVYPSNNPAQYTYGNNNNINGYIYSGTKIPTVDYRGKVILIVDSTYVSSLSSQLNQLKLDLIADGWQVIRHDVAPTVSVVSVKNLITADYNADTTNTKSVLLFGHIPVPYSGYIAPDGHTEHRGAWPADGYYGDMTGTWTDTTNYASTSAYGGENVAGDGRFDQSTFPANLKLSVGRVDLNNMPAFSQTEQQLLSNYLTKDHNYRTGVLTTQKQALIMSNFGTFNGEAIASSAWINFTSMFGPHITQDSCNFMQHLASTSESFQWAQGDGGAGFNWASCVGWTGDFATYDPHALFYTMFGSYFGDWNVQNNLLRAPLAQSTYGLASAWSGRPKWYFHGMALGETLGDGYLKTANNNNQSGAGTSGYTASYGSQFISINLMGDPTLRNDTVLPPSSVQISTSTGQISLSWTASADSIEGYNIYRATSTDALFSKINSQLVSGTTYTDSIVDSTTYVYQVRAVKLESNYSGSYYNSSLGAMASIDNSGNATIVLPSTPTNFAVTSTGQNSVSLQWTSPTNFGSVGSSTKALNYYSIYKDGLLVSTTTSTSATINSLQSSTSYTIQLSDTNTANYESATTSISVTTSTAASNNNGGGNSGGSSGGGGGPVQPQVQVISTTTPLLKPLATTTPIIIQPGCENGNLFNIKTGVRCSLNLVSSLSPVVSPLTSSIGSFTKDLQVGSSNTQVKSLQQYLNTHGFTIALNGAGSLGKETTTFGPATKAALIKFQKANGIVPASGFFGPLTKKYINAHP